MIGLIVITNAGIIEGSGPEPALLALGFPICDPKFVMMSLQKIFLRLVPVLLISGSFVNSSQAIQTDNHGIHSVPPPAAGEVRIDGDLADWDLSGAILITYDLENLLDVYSLKVSSMYDEKNLYLALQWIDATPMGNSHDPRYSANRAWAGDAVQVRLKTDRISHLTAWYYGVNKEPAMQIAYGKSLTEPFGGGDLLLLQTEKWELQKGAAMAFKADDDGRGYVQEMRIPWELITEKKKYQGGDQFKMGFEVFWGEADWPTHRYADNLAEGATSREFFWTAHQNWGPVFLEEKGSLDLPDPGYLTALRNATESDQLTGPVEIRYTLAEDARVTLAIEDEAGRRIRNLVPALPRKAGENIEKWDGLDDAGKPVPPGDYRFKALSHDGIRLNYALSFANPGNPTWQTHDGRGAFYGDHTSPQAAAAGGDFIALATPMGEAGKHLIGTNLEGQRLWGLPNRVAFDGGKISLATEGKTLWVGTEGKESLIYRVNIENGRYLPWEAEAIDEGGNIFFPVDLKVSEIPGMSGGGNGHGGLAPNLRAIAFHGGTLAAAFAREDEVRLLDASLGTVMSKIAVKAPQALTFTSDGNLLVLSEGKILRIREDGSAEAFTEKIFPEGWGLASGGDGSVYLSVRGEDQNVKVFSSKGELVREIGERGGRPHHGKFKANAMRNPAGIAVDRMNRIWVTESTENPKRTSVWNVETGELLMDLSGTTSYAGAGTVNPFDPSMGFADNTVYHLDWESGKSWPVYSIGNSDHPDALFPPSVHNLTSRVVKQNGLLYVYTTGSARGSREVQVTLFDGSDWRSVAYVGLVSRSESAREGGGKFQHRFFEGHDNERFVWSDENGDGLVQEKELQFATIEIDGKPVQLRSYYWGQLPDTEGTISYMVGGRNELVQFVVTGYHKSGAPIYDLSKPKIIRPDQEIIGGGNGEGQLIGGANGRIYLNQDPLIMVEADGHVVGGYPNHLTSVHGSHDAKAARPGYLIGPSSFLGVIQVGETEKGEAGEIFCLNGNLGENFLFTHDGLFIQSIFKDTRGFVENPAQAVRGMPTDTTTAGGESFGGNFVRTVGGDVYLTNGGTDARVNKVSGLESIRRFSGKFTYSKEEYAEAQADLADKHASERVSRDAVIMKGSAVIDGKFDDWPGLLDESAEAIEIQEDARRRYGRVEARYDDKNLYLGYRVFSKRSAPLNNGQDERLLFKSGDAVDLMIGPDTDKEGPGQQRLLMTFRDGKPVAVLNQKSAPGAAKSEKFDFSSPWRTISFDRVVTSDEVILATARISGGYFVEAAVPWEVLGITPASGLSLRGDFGILFGDGGTQTVSRQYWSNKSTGLVNDVPGEADLTPRLWGSLKLE